MKRRTMLSTACVAAAAGAGVAWWRSGRSTDAGAGIGEAATASLWAQHFERPEGGDLALERFRGTPLLLNFWATWCPPCLKEMPLLDAFQRDAAGWQVVGLAVDSPTPVRDYLARLPMRFPVGLAGMDGVALTRTLGNASGALPFTVVFDRRGKAVTKQLGAVAQDDLTRWFRAYS